MATVVNMAKDTRFGNLGRGLGNAAGAFQEAQDQKRRQAIMTAMINSGAGAGSHTTAEAMKKFQSATAGMDVKTPDLEAFVQMHQQNRETWNTDQRAKEREEGLRGRATESQAGQNRRTAATESGKDRRKVFGEDAEMIRTQMEIQGKLDAANIAAEASTNKANAPKQYTAEQAGIADAALTERGRNPAQMEPETLRKERGKALQNVKSLAVLSKEFNAQFGLPPNAQGQVLERYMSKEPQMRMAKNRALDTADDLIWLGVDEGTARREAMEQAKMVPTAGELAEGTRVAPAPVTIIKGVTQADMTNPQGKILPGSYGESGGQVVKFTRWDNKTKKWRTRRLK